MRRILAQITPVLLLTAILSGSAAAQYENSVRVLSEYIDMLASGNYETAELMWTESAQERAARFDIKYTGVPVKVDATSPIVRNLDRMARYLARTAKNQEELKDGYVRLVFASTMNGEQIEHTYYMVRDGDWYWLTNPQDYFARYWPVVESQYFRVHYHADRKANIAKPFLDEADRLLEELAGQMELSSETLRRIQEAKIEFFFCSSDDDVAEITGHKTRGTFDLASNDIISASFPHLHELTHLLAAIKLGEQPLYTLPLFREGLAVAMGGRWGKGVEPLLDLARFLLLNDFVQIDSLLTMASFEETNGADIVYPLAGLWSRWLVNQIGLKAYFELYRSFSGKFADLYAMTPDEVKQELASRLGRGSWDELHQSFLDYVENGMLEDVVSGAGIDRDSKIIKEVNDLVIRETDDSYSFQYKLTDSLTKTVTLLIEPETVADGSVSSLYAEHFGSGRPYQGHRLAVRFDRNEAGLYNYRSNRIIAKYIVGISADNGVGVYYDLQNEVVAFHLSKRVFGKVDLSEADLDLITE